MTPNQTIGANIRRLRLDLGMTQDELAHELRLRRWTPRRWDQPAVSMVEAGKSPLRVADLPGVARALSCDVETLLEGVE